jgi:YfiH family protein
MDEMKVLTSPLLSGVPGLAHGFGQRVAGPRERARETAKRILGRTGKVFFLKQVHGCTVAVPPWSQPPEADASVTGETGTVLAIETADCLPVLIVDPIGRRTAAAHAGWRGTAAGIARRTVEALVEMGSNPRDLLAALGPAIGRCCYEVGGEVEESFGPEGAAFFFPGQGERPHLDLVAANRAQLLEAGLESTGIDSLDLCTRCREDLFFSYRRDGGSAGRMISAVGFSR